MKVSNRPGGKKPQPASAQPRTARYAGERVRNDGTSPRISGLSGRRINIRSLNAIPVLSGRVGRGAMRRGRTLPTTGRSRIGTFRAIPI